MAWLSSHFIFPPTLTNGAFPLASHGPSVADLLCHSSRLVAAFTVHAVPMAGTRCPLKKRTGTNHLSFFPLLFQVTTSHIVWPCRLKAVCLPPACLDYMPTLSLLDKGPPHILPVKILMGISLLITSSAFLLCSWSDKLSGSTRSCPFCHFAGKVIRVKLGVSCEINHCNHK